jgi:hypothetical protein
MFDVPFIEATGLENVRIIISSLKKRGVTVTLSESNKTIMEKLKRSGA